MKFVIMGAGAVGSAFGGFLRLAGHEVTLIGRRVHMDAIQKRGLRISGIWGTHLATGFTCCTSTVGLGPGHDAILVCVKSYDTARAAGDICRILSAHTLVVSLQNGIGNIETIRDSTRHRLVLGGRVIFGTVLSEPGAVEVTVYTEPVVIGFPVWVHPVSADENRMALRVVEAIDRAGIPCTYTGEIEKYLWAKLLYNCALNPLSAIHGVHYGALGEKEEWRKIMEGIVREIFAVARAGNISLFWSRPEEFLTVFYQKLLPETYHHRSSMLQDIRAGRPTEIDSLCGVVVRLGREYGVPTPNNQALLEQVRTISAANRRAM